ncbi:branched-chain amino acid transport system II carrier protein [Candidatus Gromoviella agglomerans]|uniref:branched-chain amino acid transport system II carrier protein n=1 Tax=Candidatus Gromoviella agglomerans TaxID=2806609 RepID=UPI001E5B0802|nr:branched-chain amino acid transport system II carrier protein [Candidatus Gromoviella agglomerans]UFX98358.1 Branched-chain amino acid transporter family protein [Candidatus Gromoviella agglomerans]
MSLKKISRGLLSGTALFSMFFGSGNLIFPLIIGSSSRSLICSIIGVFISAVLVPLIGLFSKIIKPGPVEDYFNNTGKYMNSILISAIVMLIGSFGVAPRCILLSYGSFTSIYPNTYLWLFSFIYTCISIVFIAQKNGIINVVGKYMTPILLISVLSTILYGLYAISDQPIALLNLDKESLFSSLVAGYQTMDLLAAIFFAFTIQKYFSESKSWLFDTTISFLVASLLLLIIYGGFIYLSFGLQDQLKNVSPDMLLVHLINILFGKYASPVLVIIINIACITTFVALIDIFSNFIQSKQSYIFPFIKSSKISENRILHLIISGAISFFVSLLGFDLILLYIGKVMKILYPCVMAYSVGTIIEFLAKKSLNINKNLSGSLFYIVLFISVLLECLE